MSVVAKPRFFSLAVNETGCKEMVIKANAQLPSVTAQDVGREIYHGRQAVVRIIGDESSLKKIAWIFQRVPDMFVVRFQNSSLIVRPTPVRASRYQSIKVNVGPVARLFATFLDPIKVIPKAILRKFSKK